MLGKVVQCNVRFGFNDRHEVHLNNVRAPAGNGKRAEETKGRSLDTPSAFIKSIVVVKAGSFCMAHALIIVMSRVNRDQKYKSYRNG